MDDVLCEILFLVKPNYLKNFRLVCKYWNEIYLKLRDISEYWEKYVNSWVKKCTVQLSHRKHIFNMIKGIKQKHGYFVEITDITKREKVVQEANYRYGVLNGYYASYPLVLIILL